MTDDRKKYQAWAVELAESGAIDVAALKAHYDKSPMNVFDLQRSVQETIEAHHPEIVGNADFQDWTQTLVQTIARHGAVAEPQKRQSLELKDFTISPTKQILYKEHFSLMQQMFSLADDDIRRAERDMPGSGVKLYELFANKPPELPEGTADRDKEQDAAQYGAWVSHKLNDILQAPEQGQAKGRG